MRTKPLALLIAAAALAACTRAPAAPAATRAPNGAAVALEQRLRALPPTVRVRTGDRIDASRPFLVEMPDGSAPTIDLPSLLQAQGKRAALFWFYQMDNTSWWAAQAAIFRDRLVQAEKAGILVIGVSQDDVASHASFRKNERLNYPLAADVDGGLCTAFGACRDFQRGGFNLYQRVAFLVAADGVVLGAWSLNGPDEQVHAALDQAVAQ